MSSVQGPWITHVIAHRGHAKARLHVMAGIVDYGKAASVYERGRALAPEDLRHWKSVIDSFVDTRRTTVVDVGSGTGIFTRAWCSWGSHQVFACEPSPAMRREALQAGWPAGAAMVAAKAEQLPLAADVIDVMWLSTVLHHITDRNAWAAEAGRVLKRGGWLFVRNQFSELGKTPWSEVLPGWERASEVFPRLSDVAELLAFHGLDLVDSLEVAESSRNQSPQAVAGWIRRMRSADSLLLAFSDEEINVGLDRLESFPTGHVLEPLQVGLAIFRVADGKGGL